MGMIDDPLHHNAHDKNQASVRKAEANIKGRKSSKFATKALRRLVGKKGKKTPGSFKTCERIRNRLPPTAKAARVASFSLWLP